MTNQLQDFINNSETSIMFNRNGDTTITFSSIGYYHAELAELERRLLAEGYKDAVSKGHADGFDRMSGRTFSTFKEPKQSIKVKQAYMKKDNTTQRMADVVAAIHSIKSRLKEASHEEQEQIIGDLLALENCLVTEVELFLKGER